MYRLSHHLFSPILTDSCCRRRRDVAAQQLVDTPVRDDLPRPEKVTGETNVVEVREPAVRRLGLGRGVEKLRDGGVGWRGPLFFVTFGDGFGGDTVGNEAPAEGGGVFRDYYLCIYAC